MSHRHRTLKTFLAATLLGTLAAGCGEDKAEVAITATPVLVTPVVMQDVSDRIEATGQLLAKAQATVAAQVGGQVTEIAQDEGSSVETGQVVLAIDPERRSLELANQRAQSAQANAQLEEARRDLGRVEKLRKRNAVSQAQLDEAKTHLRLARARVEAARAQFGLAQRAVEDSTVKAPFGGLIGRRHINAGEFVTTGQPLFELVALDPIEVEFFLSESDLNRVRVGLPVEVQVSPFPEERFKGEVTVVSPTIDPATRTLRVKADLENRDGRLRPGLFARADLGVAQRSGVAMVPEDAVLQRADGAVLFVMEGPDAVRRLRIDTGIYQDGFVEVTAGIGSEDLVVVRGPVRAPERLEGFASQRRR